MKLTLNRREEQEGLIRKKTVYYLDVDLAVTPEEVGLIKKHKWGKNAICTAIFSHTQDMEWTMVVDVFLEGPKKFGFKSIGQMASAENQIIENLRILKANLEAAAGFTAGGPQEIEL